MDVVLKMKSISYSRNNDEICEIYDDACVHLPLECFRYSETAVLPTVEICVSPEQLDSL